MKSSHTVFIQAESSVESNTEYQFNISRLSDSSDSTVQENTCVVFIVFSVFCLVIPLHHFLACFGNL
jgi:hypothetical protein